MGCGGLSVMEGTGTLGMPLWCAGSFATNMKVSIQTHNSHFHKARMFFLVVPLHSSKVYAFMDNSV